MRLIDGDALCVHIEEEFDGVCVYDVSGNEAAREFCDMVDIAPTIDAIPVEWLREFDLYYAGISGGTPYMNELVKAWQKGQEAR